MKKRTYDHTRNFGDIGLKNANQMSSRIPMPEAPAQVSSPNLSGMEIGTYNPNEEATKKHFYLEYDFKPSRYDQVIDITAVRNIVTRSQAVDTFIYRGNIYEYVPGIGKELIITRINFFVLKSNWPIDPRNVGPGHVVAGVFAYDDPQFGHIMADPMEFFNMINFEVTVNGVPPVSFLRKVRYEDANGLIVDADQQGPSALSFDIINDSEPRPGSFFLRVPQQNQLVVSFLNRHTGSVPNEYQTYQSPRSVGMKLRGFLRDMTSDKRRDRDRSI